MRHKLYPRRLLPRRIGSFVGQCPWTPRSRSSHPHSSRPHNPHSHLLQTPPRNLRLHKHLLNGFIFSFRKIGTQEAPRQLCLPLSIQREQEIS